MSGVGKHKDLFPIMVFGIVLLAAIAGILAINTVLHGPINEPTVLNLPESPNLGGAAIAPGTIIANYASPYDEVLQASQPHLLASTTCLDTGCTTKGVNITVLPATDGRIIAQYTYKTGYYTAGTTNKVWTAFTFPQTTVTGTNWIMGGASFITPALTSTDQEEYVIAFVCRKYTNTTGYVCGTVANTKWTIQSYTPYNPTYTCTWTQGQVCNTTQPGNTTLNSSGTCQTGQCYKCSAGYTFSEKYGQCLGQETYTCLLTAGQFCSATTPGNSTMNTSANCQAGLCYKCINGYSYNEATGQCLNSATTCFFTPGQFCSANQPPNSAPNTTGACISGQCYKCNNGYTYNSGTGLCVAVGTCGAGQTLCNGICLDTANESNSGNCLHNTQAYGAANWNTRLITGGVSSIICPVTQCGGFACTQQGGLMNARQAICAISQNQMLPAIYTCDVSHANQNFTVNTTSVFYNTTSPNKFCCALNSTSGNYEFKAGGCGAVPSQACTITPGQICSATQPANSAPNTSGTCASGNCYQCNPGYTNNSAGQCVAGCTSTCTAGQIRCAAAPNQLKKQVCGLQASGCYDWGAAVDCGSGQVCDTATNTCQNPTCITPNFCAASAPANSVSNTTRTCLTGNCYTCNAGYSYNSATGQCVACTPQCPAPNTVSCGQTINPTNGCGTCPSGTLCSDTTKICQSGSCVCNNECTSGQTQCVVVTPGPGGAPPDGTRSCTTINGCLRWGTPTVCPSGTCNTATNQCTGGTTYSCTQTAGQFCSTTAPPSGTYTAGTGAAPQCQTGSCYKCNAANPLCGSTCCPSGQTCNSGMCTGGGTATLTIENVNLNAPSNVFSFDVCNRGTSSVTLPGGATSQSVIIVKKGTTTPSWGWTVDQTYPPNVCLHYAPSMPPTNPNLVSYLGITNTQTALTIIVDPTRSRLTTPVTQDAPATGTACFGTCTPATCSYAGTSPPPAGFACSATCPTTGYLGTTVVSARWNADGRNTITNAINLGGTINYFNSCCNNQYLCADGNGGCVPRGLVAGSNPWYMCLGEDSNNKPYYAVCNANTYGTGDYTTLDYTLTQGTTRYYCTRSGTAPNYNYAWSTSPQQCSPTCTGGHACSGGSCVCQGSTPNDIRYNGGGDRAGWNGGATGGSGSNWATVTSVDGAQPFCCSASKCVDNSGTGCYDMGIVGSPSHWICERSPQVTGPLAGTPAWYSCGADHDGQTFTASGGTQYCCTSTGGYHFTDGACVVSCTSPQCSYRGSCVNEGMLPVGYGIQPDVCTAGSVTVCSQSILNQVKQSSTGQKYKCMYDYMYLVYEWTTCTNC